MTDAMLSLVDITKRFGRMVAVDRLSLDIHKGEVFTLLGPSGCGKTTTLRLIAGLEQPDEGRILFEGRPVVSVSDRVFVPPHKRNLGMVFQSYAIWPHMTVFENVAYPLVVRHVSRQETRDRVMRSLELVGLGGLENRQGPQLSGGQQQRVAVARALVSEPSMLLLDEPFSNLDAKLREQMRVQLKLLLRKLKITAVFVTHDQVEALSLSERIAVMSAGHVEQLGAPRELYERPATAFVRDFLGRTVLLQGVASDGASPDFITVQLDGVPGSRIAVARPTTAAINPGEKVVVAVRPEDLSVVSSNGDQLDSECLLGTVDALLFVGDHCECRVSLNDGETILVQTPRAAVLREGETLRLKIPEEGVSVWPQ